MLKQYKIRDINKNPELHKEVFVSYSDMKDMLNGLIGLAIKSGADEKKLLLMVADLGKDKH